jgi:hypothetical protein
VAVDYRSLRRQAHDLAADLAAEGLHASAWPLDPGCGEQIRSAIPAIADQWGRS